MIAVDRRIFASAGATEAGLERLAERQLDREAALEEALGTRRRSRIEAYLDAFDTVSRRRRKARSGNQLRLAMASLRKAVTAGARMVVRPTTAGSAGAVRSDPPPHPAAAPNVLHFVSSPSPQAKAQCPRSGVVVWTSRALLTAAIIAAAIFVWAWSGSKALVETARKSLSCGDVIRLQHSDRDVAILPVDGCTGTRQHLTAPFGDMALTLALAEKIGGLEGRWHRSETVFGQDLLGIPRKILSEVGLLGPRGFSGPLQSAFESLIGDPEAISPLTKIRYVVAGMRFVAQELPTDEARARFLVERMPVLTGVGYPRGGALGAELLFGGPPGTLAQQCLYASSAGFPVHTPGDGPVHERTVKRWEKVVGRAQSCVQQSGAEADEKDEALTELAALKLPRIAPPAPLDGHAATAVRDALRVANLSHAASTQKLVLDLDAQASLSAEMPDLLERLAAKLPPDACLSDDCPSQIDYLVAVAEIVGRTLLLRAIAANRHGTLYGPLELGAEGYVPTPPRQGQASLHKIPLALIVAQSGDDLLCDRAHHGLANPDGSKGVAACDPASGRGMRPVGLSLARSENLTWRDAAARHAKEVSRLQDELAFLGETPADAATGATLGIGRVAPPERFVTLLATILGGPSDGVSPLTVPLGRGIDLEALGFDGWAVRKAAGWLEGPVGHGGTLRRTAGRVRVQGCRITHGKSGTHSGDGLRLSTIALIAAECRGGRRFVVYATVASGDARRGIGQIGHLDLAPLLEAALGAAA